MLPHDQELNEKESFIQGFYNENFNNYDKNLKNQDIHIQFLAACSLLGLDQNDLKSQSLEQEWLNIINTAYRKYALKFHPDKLSTYIPRI